MCRIPGTWQDSSTVIFTVEQYFQHRKKKKSCPLLLKNRASHCWRIVPVTVEELCQWLLKNYASDCWRIVPNSSKLWATVDGKIDQQSLARFFNSYWHNSSTVTGLILQHRAMYQEYDTWSKQDHVSYSW